MNRIDNSDGIAQLMPEFGWVFETGQQRDIFVCMYRTS